MYHLCSILPPRSLRSLPPHFRFNPPPSRFPQLKTSSSKPPPGFKARPQSKFSLHKKNPILSYISPLDPVALPPQTPTSRLSRNICTSHVFKSRPKKFPGGRKDLDGSCFEREREREKEKKRKDFETFKTFLFNILHTIFAHCTTHPPPPLLNSQPLKTRKRKIQV